MGMKLLGVSVRAVGAWRRSSRFWRFGGRSYDQPTPPFIEALEERLLLSAGEGASQSVQFMEGVAVGTVTATGLVEASGMVASRRNGGVLWTHNDSGDIARLFAIGTNGALLGEYRVVGAAHVDWEDIAVGPGPDAGVDYLYIADIGDNAAVRNSVTVYRVPEPQVDAGQAPGVFDLTGAEAIRFTYPTGPVDSESLVIDPVTGDLFILSKRQSPSRLYHAAAPLTAGTTTMMTDRGSLHETYAAAADITADGSEFLVRFNTEVSGTESIYHYRREAGQTLWDAVLAGGVRVPYTIEPNGESVAWAGDGGGYYTISEGANPPLYFYQRVDDHDAPTAALALDGSALDLDPASASVTLADPQPHIDVALTDALSGIDDATVVESQVTLRLDGQPLAAGTEYTFAYDAVSDLITLTSAGQFGPGRYDVLVSAGEAITDLQGNALPPTPFVVTILPPPSTVDDTAISESTAAGNVVVGNAAATALADNLYETIREQQSGGKPSTRYSLLDHTWIFNVVGGEQVELVVEAHRDGVEAADEFIVAYSTDNIAFTTLGAIAKLSDDDVPQLFALPAGLQGPVYVRVADADRSPGIAALDTVYVDQLVIRSHRSGLILPLVTVVAEAPTASEDGQAGAFLVARTGDAVGDLTVRFTVTGDAAAGEDYAAFPSEIVIPHGQSSVLIPVLAIDDAQIEAVETVTARLEPDAAYRVGSPDAATISILDNDAIETDILALAESTIHGVRPSGSLVDLAAGDNVYEVLREATYAGNKRSRLEHRWTFDLIGSGPFRFIVEAHHEPGVDDFAFEYSTDGVSFQRMLTVVKVADDDVPLSFDLPAGVGGMVVVRVVDTHSQSGDGVATALWIDQLLIRSGGAAGGGASMLAAGDSSPIAPAAIARPSADESTRWSHIRAALADDDTIDLLAVTDA